MNQPWTLREHWILRRCHTLHEAEQALPHRSREALRSAARRARITWGSKHPSPARPPQTLDERRLAAILQTLLTLRIRPDVETLLRGLRQEGEWRALGDAVMADRARRGGAAW